MRLLEAVPGRALDMGASFADARITSGEGTGVTSQDGRADKISQGRGRSCGVRVLVEGSWGFASTGEPDEGRVARCLERAIGMARASKGRASEPGVAAPAGPFTGEHFTSFETDPRKVPLERKLRAASLLERAAREAHGDRLVNTVVGYHDSVSREVVVNSLGTRTLSETVRTSVASFMVARSGDVRQSAHEHRAAQAGFELAERLAPAELSVRAADRAVALLSAGPPPSGAFPVVFHPSITGLLTHEALGHNAEADHVFSGNSILEGKLGTRVASDLVTIVDDATIPGSNGSYAFDSEGTPAGRRVVIERGVLKGLLHSLETAARFGVEPRGSGRAQDAHSVPQVRMSNTFIEPVARGRGGGSLDGIIAPIGEGVYLRGGSWGYVFCERGQFVCHAAEGWMIRGGRLAEHLRDVSVSGMTLKALADIDGVSSDFEMEMPGTCGKGGQGVPINAGGPYVRVRELVVGGRK